MRGLARTRRVWIVLFAIFTLLRLATLWLPLSVDQVGGSTEFARYHLMAGAAAGLGMVALVGMAWAVGLALAAKELRGELRHAYLLTALTTMLPFGGCVGSYGLQVIAEPPMVRARHEAFEQLAEHSQPLMGAIGAFESERGRPPDRLEELVPEYLDAVPETGMAGYQNFDYQVFWNAEFDPRGESWELRVHCGRGLLQFDSFVYWPSETYPDFFYGGDVERIGGWAYVHE